MNAKRQFGWGATSGSVWAALALLAAAPAAQAQSKATVSSSESVTAKVAVKSVDRAARRVIVIDDKGETTSIKAPPEARNFDNLKPGDTVTITYTLQTEYVLSAPNTALPADAVALVEARTAKGERPGGLLANQVVVTGAIVAIDTANHTLKLVSPDGGAVHTVAVKSAEGRKAMPRMKVGDTITAYVSESMLLTVQPL
jgi:hypothetical protein